MFIFRFILLFLVTGNVAKSDSKSCKGYCWNIQIWKKCKIREISLKWVNTNFLNGVRSELGIEKNYISSVVHYECASHKRCTKSRFRIVNDTVLTTSEQIYSELMDNNRKSACAIFPVYGDTSVDSVGDQNSSHYYFIPLQEFYNPIIVALKQDISVASKTWETILSTWPVFALCFICALISGAITWLLERSKNSEEFPKPFFKGLWEGIWWAVVTMTTVGYGDKSPRSVSARVFASLWMFVGIFLISLFTANLSSVLTANEIQSKGTALSLADKKIGVPIGSKFYLGTKTDLVDAKLVEFKDFSKMKAALLTGDVDAVFGHSKFDLRELTKSLGDRKLSRVLNLPFALGIGVKLTNHTWLDPFISCNTHDAKGRIKRSKAVDNYREMVSRDNWIKQMETKGGRGTDITPLSKGSMESIKEILPYAATLMFPIILIGGLCELIKLVRKKKKKKIERDDVEQGDQKIESSYAKSEQDGGNQPRARASNLTLYMNNKGFWADAE